MQRPGLRPGSPRSRRIVARLFRSGGDGGVVRARRRPRSMARARSPAAGPRPGHPGPAGSWRGCSGRWRRRGGRVRRRPRRWPGRVRPAAGPRPGHPGPAGSGEVVQVGGDVGVVGSVGGFVDGQGPFWQRPGRGRLTQVPQDQGEVVQVGGDVGVVRARRRPHRWPGRVRPAAGHRPAGHAPAGRCGAVQQPRRSCRRLRPALARRAGGWWRPAHAAAAPPTAASPPARP